MFGTYNKSRKSISDKTFLVSIIQNIIDVLPEPLNTRLIAPLMYQSSAKASDTIQLGPKGSSLLVYYQVFKEKYPDNPTSEQISKMNAVWIGLGYPENVLPT